MAAIDEYVLRGAVTPEEMDDLWAAGWRHFGVHFFRYSHSPHPDGPRLVIPLRVDLARFVPSRSQRRVTARNRNLRIEIRDAFIDRATEAMFYAHRERFKENVPDSLRLFLSKKPATVPCTNRQLAAYLDGRLAAVSFLDIGRTATSAVYAMFDPGLARRSLGIYTMLEAIRYSRELGRRYYYPGYAHREPSIYDYKKKFAALEWLEWGNGWRPLDAPGGKFC